MPNSDQLKFLRMEEEQKRRGASVGYRYFPLPRTDDVTPMFPSEEAVRALIRDELTKLHSARAKRFDEAMADVDAHEEEDEVVAILAEYSEQEFERLVARVEQVRRSAAQQEPEEEGGGGHVL